VSFYVSLDLLLLKYPHKRDRGGKKRANGQSSPGRHSAKNVRDNHRGLGNTSRRGSRSKSILKKKNGERNEERERVYKVCGSR